MDIRCNNGTYVVDKGRCLTPCVGGSVSSNGVTLSYAQFAHGDDVKLNCYKTGSAFSGQLALKCDAGEVKMTGACKRECVSSTITSRGAVLPFDSFQDSTPKILECATGNMGSVRFSGQVELACDDGTISVKSGECYKDCAGPTTLFQIFFDHGLMSHGEKKVMECGSTGQLTLLCTDGTVANFESTCYKSCPPQSLGLIDARSIGVSWTVSIPHDQIYPTTCDPTIATGTADVKCEDGIPRITGSSCRLNCDAGKITQPDPEKLYTFPIELQHSSMFMEKVKVWYVLNF